jgi:predicted TIM-barrel fold metal-dependent hydrolase
MYARDYPHSDMDWNRVQTIKASEALTAAEKSDFLGENARRFYHLQI